MSNYDNEKSGVLFRNDRKETDSHPDYKGSATVEGTDYWLSAWINEIQKGEKAGQKYMKIKLKPKDQQGGGEYVGSTDSGPSPDDNIPF